jgi:hypothetical protein
MTNLEFSNTFDVLYNNINSNQAPGLDEYEKSVFLTKAQDEIVKAYFNPRLNKTQEGFDANEKRQIDFSMIMRSVKYESIEFTVNPALNDKYENETIESINDISALINLVNKLGVLSEYHLEKINAKYIELKTENAVGNNPYKCTANPFTGSFFDYRENTKSIILDSSILMFVNEYVMVKRKDVKTRLTVVPINYSEYSRLMSKPYKRPLNYQAWRILDNSATDEDTTTTPVKKVELVIGPNDEIEEYVIRYVKRPRAIRLITFDTVTLDGGNEEQSCELDPVLHQEILQRAVELAKAVYAPNDLTGQLTLGQSSQTSIGAVATQASR